MGAFTFERPTLPAIHTLGLPNPSARPQLQGLNGPYESSYASPSCPRLHIPQWRQTRRVSTSSSNTSCSSSPEPEFYRIDSPPPTPTTPVLSISPLPSSRAPQGPQPHHAPIRFRLEPCTLEEAQAIVLVPPPSAPFVPSPANPTPMPAQKRQALLLVGPALQHFRNPQRQIAKGARVHPYRIMPSQRKLATRPPMQPLA